MVTVKAVFLQIAIDGKLEKLPFIWSRNNVPPSNIFRLSETLDFRWALGILGQNHRPLEALE